MLPSWCRDSVTIIQPGTKTVRAATVPDWDNVTETAVSGCSLQPGASGFEMSQERVSAVQADLTAYIPAGVPVNAGDRVRVDASATVAQGDVYTVDGEPERFPSPFGTVAHIRLSLRKWSG